MHSSDETGDERKGLASTGGSADGETAKLPAHAFRERIRRASVAAAQASTPPTPPAAVTATGPHTPVGSHGSPALLVPEQSGVHDRTSDAPPQAASAGSRQSSTPDQASGMASTSGSAGDAAGSGAPQQANSWPFATGRGGQGGHSVPEDRRAPHHTQLGLGAGAAPQRSAAAGNARASDSALPRQADAATELSDARRRMDTRDTKRSGAAVAGRVTAPRSKSSPPPASSKSTPPRPFRARDSKWSPTSTKPQRASLLRGDGPKEDDVRSFTKTMREGPRAKASAQQALQPEDAGDPQALASYTLSALADEYLEVSVDAHGLSISASDSSDEQHSQDAEVVEAAAPAPVQDATSEAASGDEPDGARARRYTPKQRGRSRERSASEERAEYAATIPDLRPTFAAKAVSGPGNKTVRGQGPQQAHQPQQHSSPPALPNALNAPGKASVSGPSGALHLNHLSPIPPGSGLMQPSGPNPANLAGTQVGDGAQAGHVSHPVTPDTPTQPRGKPVPRLPLVASPQLFTTKPAFAHPAAFGNARQPQAPLVNTLNTLNTLNTVNPLNTVSAVSTVGTAPRAPFAGAQTQRGASANYGQQHEASIVVDPSLKAQVTEVRAPQRQSSDRRPAQQPYQPLPSDPAAFEQMMRDQSAARGARLNWKQQATLVIPREELEAAPEQRLITPKMIAGFIGATIVGALIMLAVGRYGDPAGSQGKATDTSTSAAATSNTVVIATEPSGAELLLDGAVVGNTPLEVPRPPRGQVELTYVIRMRGFAQELIRLSAESQAAIRVTLTPDSGGVQ